MYIKKSTQRARYWKYPRAFDFIYTLFLEF